MTNTLTLFPGALDLQCLQQVWSEPVSIELDGECFTRIEESEAIIQQVVRGEASVYGINTGFGSLANKTISADKLKQLQRNIVLSHACGSGELLSDKVVRLIMVLKINNLIQGYSGVRRTLVDVLCKLYNAGVYPCIPKKGSVGASGDLAPLAHLTMPLIGEGDVRYKGKIMTAVEALNIVGIAPLELAPKEGLAMLNGLQVSTAIALDAFFKSEWLFETAVLAGCLSVDAASGSDVPFDHRIHKVRGHQAQINVAKMYRELLTESEIREAHRECNRVQDPYSLRCQPQIMGAVFHQMQFVGQTLQVEANGVSDNPLVFAEQEEILSGGNFHGEIIAMAADNLALAIAEMGANAERRIALLIDNHISGLPPFLVEESGLNSGFMIAHVTAASCACDNKALAHPHCVDSLPTSANQEDIVSMATNGALRLTSMIDNTATILAIELLAACQGLEFHAPLKTSRTLQMVYDKVRAYVDPYETDRYFAPDIAIIKQLVLEGEFAMSPNDKRP